MVCEGHAIITVYMKKLVLPILIIIIAIGFLFWKKQTKPINPEIGTFKNIGAGISFNYPKKLTVTNNKGEVLIHHDVPFTHHDYCDFKGEGTTTMDTLTDFNLKMRVENKSLINSVKANSPYIPEENFLNGEIIPSPGFIDPFQAGNYKGFSIFEGAEGCGHTIYYLKVKDDKTLIAVSDFITVFSGAIDTENMETAERVPGVINKTEANNIFNQIMESVKVD
jgi:hypothetical protein